LGKRAKDIDKGILVVRFELPYNIWCGSCNAHIGAGVRYNAQKRKVGNYYSTPIYAFRCKCHLCGGWFEIRTDPKNARYVVEEGARAQAAEWNPEENGGFPVFDTEAPSASEQPTDAFAHLEKQVIQKATASTKQERLTQLTNLSHRQSSDPYTLSQHARQRFREQKKKDARSKEHDDDIRTRAGLRIALEPEVEGEGANEWAVARRDSKVQSCSTGGLISPATRTESLAKQARANTIKRLDPFGSDVRKPLYTKGRVAISLPGKSTSTAKGLVDYDSD